MVRSFVLGLTLVSSLLAQPQPPSPFQPLNLEAAQGVPDRAAARESWVQLTNKRMEMSNNTTRLSIFGSERLALRMDIEGARKSTAKDVFKKKKDYALLVEAAQAYGFNHLVVRNPATQDQWTARLTMDKVIPD